MREQPQQSKLGAAAARQASPIPEPSKFVKASLGARVLEPYTIPRLGLDVKITLVPHFRATQIESDVIDFMLVKHKIELNATTELDYECERAAQYCSDAFLDAEAVERRDERIPIGTLADWRNIDRDIISECWRAYHAVRVAYDPVSQPLTDGDLDLIEDTLKKNASDPDLCLRLLRQLGIRRLSTYLLHSVGRLFPSPILKSSDSPSIEVGSGA